LAELAQRLRCRLDGDGAIDVTRVAGIEDAGPGEITFVANPKYLSKLVTTRASAAIVSESVTTAPCALLHSAHPYVAFAEAVAILCPVKPPAPGISKLASIDPTAIVDPTASIGPFVAIDAHVRIGARTIVHPHVAIGPDTTIGDDCVIHAHVSIRERVQIGH